MVTARAHEGAGGLSRRQIADFVLAPLVCLVLWFLPTHDSPVLPDNLVGYWTTTAYRLFSPDGAQPGLPALTDGAQGFSAVWTYAGSTMLAIHQSPALIFGLSVGGFRAWQVLAAGLSVLAAGSVVVMLF